MQRPFLKTLGFCLAILLASPAVPAPTDIAQLPMSTASSTAAPNVVFGIDDSGSMDWEVLLPTNNGLAWWDTGNRRYWDTKSKFLFGEEEYGYAYLFPNGTASDARRYTNYYAIPPVKEFAALRSSSYNPLYYNPAVTYTPWVPAYIDGATRSFGPASATAARSHPWFPTSGASTTLDLTVAQDASTYGWQRSNWTFLMQPGMTVPFATTAGTKARVFGSGSAWTDKPCGLTSVKDWTIPSSGGCSSAWEVAIPYHPATYYVVDSTCSSGAGCAVAPDGKKLRRYEIKSGNTFPSGRSYADEMQNFANWFQYYRKRRLLLASASGEVFSRVRGIRGGTIYFNQSSTLQMHDFSSTTDSANARAVLGAIYTIEAEGGTPTRTVLNKIGQAFMTNPSVVQYACQRNNAFVITDGFAETGLTGTIPGYNQNTWMKNRPFQTIFSKSLADIASAYYTVNLRPDLPTGQLSYDPSDTSPSADRNPNLHMTTYALTLGALGTIYGTGSAAAANPFLNYPNWPSPSSNYSPTAVDDLWHATINSRGRMFSTNDSSGLVKTLRQAVAAMLARSGSDAAVAISNVNVRPGDNTVYVSSYNGAYWSGQLSAYSVDLVTGNVATDNESRLWEARGPLNARDPDKRLIATHDGAGGVPFRFSALSAGYKAALATPSASPSDAEAVVAYLRGDRSKEGTTYRTRDWLLGDIVSAQPVVVAGASAQYAETAYGGFATGIASRTRMVYQAANDGMLHAFSAQTGVEAWAYVPELVKHKLNALTAIDYWHQFYVDGTPVTGDVEAGGHWRTMLVGGLRGGGTGYYALDITEPEAKTEAAVAAKVMWEFPNAGTSPADVARMGLSFGKPVLAKTRAAGWVVLVTSGYNNTAGDGKGHLFVLNPVDGSVIKTLSTSAGSPSDPSGLAQVSAYATSAATDATVEAAYGGDLMGNLWRFDLSGATVASWGVSRLATLTDSLGTPQAVTTAPELTMVQGKPLVVVGTGRLLGQSDITNVQTQSYYGILDSGDATALLSPRTALLQKTVTVGDGNIRNINSDAVDFAVYRGWYFDLPGTGERINTDATIIFGALVFASNQPSQVACEAKSFLYAVDVRHGGQLPASGFLPGEALWSGMEVASVLANQPVVALLPNGLVKALTHAADGTLASTRVPLSASGRLKAVAWRELRR